MNEISKVISSIDEADISNLHKKKIAATHYSNLTDCLEKGGSRSEILIYVLPLYVAGNTQLADHNW